MRYSYEQRRAAVELFIESGGKHKEVIEMLGYGTRWSIDRWHQDYLDIGHVRKVSARPPSKFTQEQKQMAVDYFLTNGQNLLQTVQTLGYPSRTLLTLWVDELAPNVRKNKRTHKKFTQAEKIETVIGMSAHSGSIAQSAQEFDIDKVTLHNWRWKLLGKDAAKTVKDINDEHLPDDVETLKEMVDSLKQDVRRQKLEIAVLEGVAELIKKEMGAGKEELTNQEKTILVCALRNDFALPELLSCLDLARSSYYYQRKVLQAPDKYYDLRLRIRNLFEKHDKNWGYRRIWAGLRSEVQPTKVSEKIVREIMRQEGLFVIYNRKPKRKWSAYTGEHGAAPVNLVQRNFSANVPNELWLTDIAQFSLRNFKCYLSPVIDCFDGKVVSWSISKSPNAQLVNSMLAEATQQLSEGQRPIIHSDQGWHYWWPEWIELCIKANLTRSMSRKGCTQDNSACEGFFGRLKNEFFYHRNWNNVSYDVFEEKLNQYIMYYNEERIKQSLGYLSPNQYRRSLGIAA